MKKVRFILFSILVGLSLSACAKESLIYTNEDETVVVSIENNDECYLVKSDNPVTINKGETASFKIDPIFVTRIDAMITC